MSFEAVDLFCGAGGSSCGIKFAGFDVLAGVDKDKQALQTHLENLPGEPIVHDLSDVDPGILPPRAQNPDYLHGSPPCKGFSTANEWRTEHDVRNSLLFDFVDWVDALQPKVVSMENVTGMLSISDRFMDKMEAAFRDIDYRVKWRQLNAADYGVPQTRKRIITIAIRSDQPSLSQWFPRPTHAETATNTLDGRELEEWVSVKDAIGDLPGLEHTPGGFVGEGKWRDGTEPSHTISGQGSMLIRSDSDLSDFTVQFDPPRVLPNHEAIEHDRDTMERMEAVDHGSTEHPAFTRPYPDEPSFTIIGGHHAAPIHYKTLLNHDPTDSPNGDPSWEGSRRLTVRECARLQSFPDWFVFTGTKTEQYEQVGNAVPPLLQYHIASNLREFLERAESE